jgi:subtilisin family serine protease
LGYDGSDGGVDPIKIAVLDSGFQVGSGTGHAAKHGDFPAMIAGTDYEDYSVYPLPDPRDYDIANTVTGHGTHVAGSALGRGTQSSGVYKGSAPGADPIFLKIGSDATGSAPTAAMVNAVQDAVDVYNADVITMSYGGWSTYHDGTSQTSQAVDYAVNQGAVVFISAGNNANDDEHYSGTVAASSSTGFIQVDVTSAGINNTALAYNLVWYDGISTNNDLELEYYDSGQNPVASTDFTQTESSRGTESEYSYKDTYVGVGSSTYYLKVKNNSASSQSFHIYYDSGYNGSGAGTVKFNAPDANYTIGSPAEADSAIAVGAYTTRKYWTNYKGSTYSYTSGETVDLISTFSSRGPRVDGSPPKPNIIAPGSAIISARDDDVYPIGPPPRSYDPSIIDNDGLNLDGSGPADYYVMQGTSMACPIAAGVAALILDKNPTWTPAQVRHALESTATDKGTSGVDDIYGWGLIDALAAVNSSLPPFDSYREGYPGAGGTQDDLFSDFATENTVYMYATGLLPSHPYRVAYYDGNNNKVATDDVSSDSSGNLQSQHTFVEETDTAGTWNVIVSERDFTPDATYDSTWEYRIASDTFTVAASAIPEFPTVLAVIMVLALSAGIYLWMRRKAASVPA